MNFFIFCALVSVLGINELNLFASCCQDALNSSDSTDQLARMQGEIDEVRNVMVGNIGEHFFDVLELIKTLNPNK
jgi:hypothetical protein